MRETICLSLPKKSRQYLKRLAKERGLTISELLRDAIRKYLIDEEFNRVRKKVLTKLLRSGKVYTDEDIFKIVSWKYLISTEFDPVLSCLIIVNY